MLHVHVCIVINFIIINFRYYYYYFSHHAMPRQLLTTEDWHNVFYSYIGPYRRENRWIAGLVAMYYGAVILIGSCIVHDNSVYLYMYTYLAYCIAGNIGRN